MKLPAWQRCIAINAVEGRSLTAWRHRTFSLLAPLLLSPVTPLDADAIQRSDRIAVRSLLELRDDRVIRQHWDLSCGAAAVATLLTFQLGDPVTEREAAVGMLHMGDIKLVRSRLGFSLLDLKRFVAKRGFLADGYGNLELADLLAMVPAITPVRVGGYGHFVIVRGLEDGRLIVADPAFGNRTMRVAQFLSAWPTRTGFTVTRPGDPHPRNRMAVRPGELLAPSGAALRAAEADVGRRAAR